MRREGWASESSCVGGPRGPRWSPATPRLAVLERGGFPGAFPGRWRSRRTSVRALTEVHPWEGASQSRDWTVYAFVSFSFTVCN